MWSNWAGDQRCEPAAIERPSAVGEVVGAVARARAAGRCVRVAGSGHSFTGAALTDGTLVSLDRIGALLAVDFAAGLVRVQAGIEVCFVAGDDALLSPAHERDTVYVAVHAYKGMAWEPYFRAVEAIADEHGGRPHWGKRHFQTEATLAPRYPGWQRFAAVRARLDPDGLFSNAYTDGVLGPVSACVVGAAQPGQ